MLDLTGAVPRSPTSTAPTCKPPPWTPVTPPRLIPPDEDEPADVFAAIRAGDILVHHPYESFAASVERFITQAADDPDVLTIKQTLYRTSGDSPIVQSLIRAAERGKQVVVLVEIKARFDEEANIVWARKLERAGAHVVYGLVGLKTHSKTALVVRREGSGPAPLRPHRDRQLQPEDRPAVRRHRPADLPARDRRRRHRPVQRPDRPVAPADVPAAARRAAQPALAVPRPRRARDRRTPRPGARHGSSSSSTRSSTSPVIEALYRASSAGVDIDLIIRGACSLQPGLPGRLRADPRPLDHRRVPRALADLGLRERRRARVVHRLGRPDGPQPRPPGRGGRARSRITRRRRAWPRSSSVMLADDRRSWQLQPDATLGPDRDARGPARARIDTFETLKEDALAHGSVVAAPRRPGAGAGSLDPRA